MAQHLSRRLLHVVTVLFLISMLAPLLPPASAQEASTPTTMETTTTDPVVTDETLEIAEPTLTPADTTPPVVTVPDTINVTADTSGLADVQFGDQIWAVDDSDGSVAVTAEPPRARSPWVTQWSP